MSPTAVIVRPCEEADLPALHAHEVNPEANVYAEHVAKQKAGEYVWAAAWRGDEPLGTVVLDWHEQDFQPELKRLWVYPSGRRQGVGRALTTWVENYARELGFREVFLAVSLDNEAAIPLYVSLDYSPTGKQRRQEYHYIDAAGEEHDVDEVAAVFRKSLMINDA